MRHDLKTLEYDGAYFALDEFRRIHAMDSRIVLQRRNLPEPVNDACGRAVHQRAHVSYGFVRVRRTASLIRMEPQRRVGVLGLAGHEVQFPLDYVEG